MSIAGYEASAEVTPVHLEIRRRASPARRSSRRRSSRATSCSAARRSATPCHRDGGPGEDPLFTDFTASNIGTPANPRLPFYAEDQPGRAGLCRQSGGRVLSSIAGVGGFLAAAASAQPALGRGRALAAARPARTSGAFQVPTLRNVDKRPYPGFVKAYGHNGYFTSLKEIVHFYNTRDVLPRCRPRRSRRGDHLLAGAGEHPRT